MEGKELEQYVVNCLEWARLEGWQPLVQPRAFMPNAPGWIMLSSQLTVTSKQLYSLYVVEVYKQSTKS